MVTQGLEVRDDVRQLVVRDPIFRERGHGPETVTDLKPNQKTRQWFVVDRRAQPSLAGRMTLRAVCHEDPLPPPRLFIKR
jgi:hypothetical protein